MRSAPDRLLTPRLRLERLVPEYIPELSALIRHPLVAPTLSATGAAPEPAAAVRMLRRNIVHWEAHGFGLWAALDRATGALVGEGGLQRATPEASGATPDIAGAAADVEAVWSVHPERWGQGLATEIARACVEVGLGRLELPRLVALTLPENLASRRVMERAGFRFDRNVRHAGLEHVRYIRGR